MWLSGSLVESWQWIMFMDCLGGGGDRLRRDGREARGGYASVKDADRCSYGVCVRHSGNFDSALNVGTRGILSGFFIMPGVRLRRVFL